MSKPMIFPWAKRPEVARVYKELYSDDPTLQQHAIGRVAVWNSRSLHKLPIALESTAALVNASREQQGAGHTEGEELSIRNVYSIALIRFINHITEKGQTKQVAQSVSRIAGELGVPEWIVDLRHEATHGKLPSLAVLRAATHWSLEWLREEFWEKQIEGSSKSCEIGKKLDTLRGLLMEYRERSLAESTRDPIHKSDESLRAVNKICSELGHEACPCVVEEALLKEDQLSLLGITKTELLKSSVLPLKLIKFWTPLFQHLQKCDLINSLLLHMVTIATENVTDRNKLIYGWIFTIIQQNDKEKTPVKSNMLKTSFPMPYRQFLYCCIQVPNVYAKDLLYLLLNRVDVENMDSGLKQRLRQLLSTYYGNKKGMKNIVVIDATTDPLHTVQDLKMPTQTKAHEKPAWSVCTEQIDWLRVPIGVLANQSIGYKSLELGTNEEEDEEMEEELLEELNPVEEEIMEVYEDEEPVQTKLWRDETLQFISERITVF